MYRDLCGGSVVKKLLSIFPLSEMLFAMLLLGCLSVGLTAQAIEYTLPEDLSQCFDDDLLIEVSNPGGSIADIDLEISNPCGIFYLPGSVENAVENDISDLNQPTFTIEDVEGNASVMVSITLHADCSYQDCADNAEINTHDITASVNGMDNTITTDPYDIELPLILVQALDNSLLQGSACETFSRNLTITNSRRGPVDYFELVDFYPSSLEILSDDGTPVSSGADSLVLSFGPDDFMQIGDLDGLFEFNEQLIVEEIITIKTCNSDSLNSISQLSTRWYCDEGLCDNPVPEQIAIVETLLNPNEGSILEITPNPTIPNCGCLDSNYQFGMTIENTSAYSSASNFHLEILSQRPLFTFAMGTPVLQSEEDTIELVASWDLPLNPTCIEDSTYRMITIDIPLLDKDTTYELLWWNNYCNPSGCSDENGALGIWDFEISYEKDCANFSDSFHTISDSFVASSEQANPLSSGIITEFFNDGDTFGSTSEFVFSGDSLYIFNGQLEVEFSYICDLNLVESDWSLGGQSPTNLTSTESDGLVTLGFTYDLPLDPGDDSVEFELSYVCGENCSMPYCETLYVTSCNENCFAPNPPTFGAQLSASLIGDENCPDLCRPAIWESVNISPDCEWDICEFVAPGYALIENFETARSNYGEPDNDNNNSPDTSGVLDFTMVRTDRALSGDTLVSTIDASVVVDDPSGQIEFAYLDLMRTVGLDFVHIDAVTTEAMNFLNKSNGLQILDVRLEIFDSSTGFSYQANQLIDIETDPFDAFFDLSPSTLISQGYFIPNDFLYETGDSISIEITQLIGYNVGNGLGNIPLTNLTLTPQIILSKEVYNEESEYLLCRCPSSLTFVSAFQHDITTARLTLPTCELGSAEANRQFLFRLHQLPNGTQFFPFEHRNLYLVEFYGEPVYEGSMMVQSDISIFNGGAAITGVLEPVDSLDLSVLPFDELPLPPAFEWAQYNLDNTYVGTECKAPFSESYQHVFQIFFAPTLLPFIDPAEFENNAVVNSAAPELLFTASCNVSSFSDELEWQIQIVNKRFIECNDDDHISTNTWFSVSNPSGLVEDFTLTNIDTEEPVELLGDVFQLGTMVTCDTLTLILNGTNTSCNTEDVFFSYGWHCEAHTNSLATTCSAETVHCSGVSPPGFLDSDAPEEPLVAPLCEETPLTEIEINNVGNGSIYNLLVEAQLPPGATVAPNSSQVTFPIENGSVSSIDDPVDLGEGLFQFVIEDDLFDNGLDGVNALPENSFLLGYEIETGCDMLSGAYVIYTTSSEQVCGNPTNTVSEVGPQVFINGAGAAYENAVNVSGSEINVCDNEMTITLSSSSSDVFLAGDQITSQFPFGVTYVTGSCSGTLADCTPNINGVEWTWDLTPGEDEFELTFTIAGLDNMGCGLSSIPFYTVTETEAICAGTGESCGILVSTGSDILNIQIDRPYFIFEDIEVIANTGDEANVQITWTNLGADSYGTVDVAVFVDTNGNGSVDGQDMQIYVYTFDENVLNGGTTTFVISDLDLPIDNLCSLLFITDDSNCLCFPDESPVYLPVTYENFFEFGLCSNESITLSLPDGVSEAYFWVGDAELSCVDCPNPTYQVENNGVSPIIEDVVLQYEDDMSGCTFQYEYNIVTNPVPGIVSAESTICQGQTASIVVTQGADYTWVGPGVPDNFNGQILEVTPNETATFMVSIVDAFGCNAADTVVVEVLPTPVADAGENINACFGQPIQLSVMNAEEGVDYFWSPSWALDDPQSTNPNVTSDDVTEFELTASNGSCESIDIISINYSEELFVPEVDPIFFCEPQQINIELNDEYLYTWEPMIAGMCLNANCSEVSFNATESTDFEVQVLSTFGCETSLVVSTVFTTEAISTNDFENICEGECLEIWGEQQCQTGEYCQTTVLDNGCTQIDCITLVVESDSATEANAKICGDGTLDYCGETITTPGEYCCSFISSIGCDSTHCLIVTDEEILLSLLATATNLADPQDVNLNAVGDFVSYEWSPADVLSCDDCPSPTASVEETTWFVVEATDQFGCAKTDSILITVGEVCLVNDLLIPDAITANGNGVNDRFRVINLAAESEFVEITVFNRWGEKVFDEENNEGWDGTFRGAPAPTGIYMYIVTFDCGDGDEKFYKGDLTLLR